MSKFLRALGVVIPGLCLLDPVVAQAASTATHAMTVSGLAHNAAGGFSCATSGPQPREQTFFNAGVGLPTEGYGYCNLSGGIDDQASATASTISHQDVTHAFNNGSNSLTADARASFGTLGVKTTGSFTGETSSLSYHDSEAAAFFSDSFLLPGSGMGTIQFGFTVEGSASSIGNSQSFVQLNYQFGTGPSYNMFSADTSYGTSRVRSLFYTDNLPGFTESGASLTGAATVPTYTTGVMLGSNFDFTIGLYAASYPGPFTGVANNDFWSTAKLTSITLLDAAGSPINFSVTGASGTIYDQNGAHSVIGGVPEPASWAMLLTGFGLVGGAMRRRAVAVTG